MSTVSTTIRSRLAHDDTGAMAILIALLTVVLFAMGAVVVDLGVARARLIDAQKAADAAAYAGGQELPNRNAARAVAQQYLLESGFDGSGGRPVVNLYDSSRSNGFVQFFGGSLRMQVATPVDRVTSPFSAVLADDGALSVPVGASATVEIRQPQPNFGLPVMPLVVPSAQSRDGQRCLELRPPQFDLLIPRTLLNVPVLLDCSGIVSNSSPYALAAVGRAGAAGDDDTLVDDLAQGIDHQPGLSPDADGPCTTDVPPGALEDPPTYTGPFNCVAAWGAEEKSAWQEALFATPADCPAGRLHDPSSSQRVLGCRVAPDRWTTLDSGPGISQDVLSDPRFGIAMVVEGAFAPLEGDTNLITDYIGYYLREFFVATEVVDPVSGLPALEITACLPASACDGDYLLSASVEYFALTDIKDLLVPNVGQELATYQPNGPKTVVLVE